MSENKWHCAPCGGMGPSVAAIKHADGCPELRDMTGAKNPIALGILQDRYNPERRVDFERELWAEKSQRETDRKAYAHVLTMAREAIFGLLSAAGRTGARRRGLEVMGFIDQILGDALAEVSAQEPHDPEAEIRRLRATLAEIGKASGDPVVLDLVEQGLRSTHPKPQRSAKGE